MYFTKFKLYVTRFRQKNHSPKYASGTKFARQFFRFEYLHNFIEIILLLRGYQLSQYCYLICLRKSVHQNTRQT